MEQAAPNDHWQNPLAWGSNDDRANGATDDFAADAPIQVRVVRVDCDSHGERSNRAIQVLVPCEQCAFHAVHRASDGRLHRTFVRAPHVAVIPAGQVHAVYGAGRSDVIVMSLDPAFFESKVREASAWQGPLAGRYAAVDPFLREVGNSLRSQLPLQRESGAYLQSLASVVAVHLARNYAAGGNGLPAYVGLAPHKLKRVQQHIAEHISEPIPVKRLAATVHMSAYHFARMFRKATGQPPHLYITMQRVEQAKTLLAEGKLSLGDVAATVGFQTQSHFTEVFRKHSGITPGMYRTKCELAAAIAPPRVDSGHAASAALAEKARGAEPRAGQAAAPMR